MRRMDKKGRDERKNENEEKRAGFPKESEKRK